MKLEAALRDEDAWRETASVHDNTLPYYAKDYVAVQLLVAVKHQTSREQVRQSALDRLESRLGRSGSRSVCGTVSPRRGAVVLT
jgi:hypothetical protein